MEYTRDMISTWCESCFSEQLSLLKELAVIPAPSHQEDLRANFIKNWLIRNGAETVIIDDAKNVVLPMNWGKAPGLCVMAHTDVVFPDTAPLTLREENDRVYAPGIGDDTANVVCLMLCAKFFLTHPDLLQEPLLIVFNSCEEGLGNLKGVRKIMEDYAGTIRQLVSFDCQSDGIISRAVGSERWRVTVSTRGGHSFSDFGSPNAIVHLSRLIDRLYSQEIPTGINSKTTFNVGLISGGTSVNTIAQQAEMTYEYRSNDKTCLAVMAKQFQEFVKDANEAGVCVSASELGIRPCGEEISESAHQPLLNRCRNAIYKELGYYVPFCCASTDANIPLSLGIPAATFGLYRGGGAHTREEYVQIDSLTPGLKIAMGFFLPDIE